MVLGGVLLASDVLMVARTHLATGVEENTWVAAASFEEGMNLAVDLSGVEAGLRRA